jgi:nascent polypeptide-associated complex subunit beta
MFMCNTCRPFLAFALFFQVLCSVFFNGGISRLLLSMPEDLVSVASGGKGTARRKTKVVHKNVKHDDKRLKTVLNKLQVRDIAAIEEVNLFKDDGKVIHFAAPKVQASIPANTYVVSGLAEEKGIVILSRAGSLLMRAFVWSTCAELKELLPGIISQLGPDNLNELKKIYASFAQDGKVPFFLRCGQEPHARAHPCPLRFALLTGR